MISKKINISILILFLSVKLIAQEKIVPFYNNGKWGLMNSKKEIIVCPKFEEAYPPYGSNLCRVKIKGKYGFLNFEGKYAIKPKYDSANDFEYGISKVTRRGKSFAIRPNGKKHEGIIGICGTHPCMIPSLRKSVNIYEVDSKIGFTHKRINKIHSSTNETKVDSIPAVFDEIVPVTHQLMYLVKDSMIAFLHEGSIMMDSKYVMENLSFVYEDLELFSCYMCKEGYLELIGFKRNGFWGFGNYNIGNELTEKIEAKYLQIESLAKGYAIVEYEMGKFGYIDYQGNEYFIR